MNSNIPRYPLCKMKDLESLGMNANTRFIKFNSKSGLRIDRQEDLETIISDFKDSKYMTREINEYCSYGSISKTDYNIILCFNEITEIYENLPELFI